jgi:hypothetical protein
MIVGMKYPERSNGHARQGELEMHFGQERRAVERMWVNRGALLTIPGVRGVYSCSVRDLSRHGASLRLNGLALLAAEFRLSLDGMHTTLACRLIWRDGDFAGLSLIDPARERSGSAPENGCDSA